MITNPDIKLYRMNKTMRSCGCCGAKLNLPIIRLYGISIGYESEHNAHSTEHVMCEDCLNILSNKLWNVDRDESKQKVYKETIYKELPKCCGDCKEIYCQLPKNKDSEIYDIYLNNKRHDKCPLRKI